MVGLRRSPRGTASSPRGIASLVHKALALVAVIALAMAAGQAPATAWAEGAIEAQVEIIGTDASGERQAWLPATTYELPEGSTVADLTIKAFEESGLEAAYEPDGPYGFSLSTITSPFDGRTLGWDGATGCYWQLFVNGEVSWLGASSVALSEGDEVTWCYSANGEALPAGDDIVLYPAVPRPDEEATWPGFANGGKGSVVEGLPTPTESAELDWAFDYRLGEQFGTTTDPVIVGDSIYVVSSGKLMRVSTETGELLASAPVGELGYFCRIAYADGLVIVPSETGSLTAYTSDTLTAVWRSPALAKPVVGGREYSYQALSSLTVSDGRVLAAFTVPGLAGALVCVDVEDGSLAWSRVTTKDETESSEGYYWAGAAVSDGDFVVPSESGRIELVDSADGTVVSALELGASVRSSVVAAGSEGGEPVFLVVSRDGSLHKLRCLGDALVDAGSVSFAAASTSTPAVAGGSVFVCGQTSDYKGMLAVIDLATMAVETTVRVDGGGAQSAPLVSVRDDGTFVYFTCNSKPGGVYVYRLGDDAASELFAPEEDLQNFCSASVIADGEGNLYYTNDSGHLFKLAAGSIGEPETPGGGGDVQPGDGSQGGEADPASGGGGGSSGSASAPSAAGGSVPARFKAIEAEEDRVEEAEDDSSSDEGASATAGATAAEVSPSDSADGGVNAWALAGVGVGAAGFAAAVIYLLVSKRGR